MRGGEQDAPLRRDSPASGVRASTTPPLGPAPSELPLLIAKRSKSLGGDVPCAAEPIGRFSSLPAVAEFDRLAASVANVGKGDGALITLA